MAESNTSTPIIFCCIFTGVSDFSRKMLGWNSSGLKRIWLVTPPNHFLENGVALETQALQRLHSSVEELRDLASNDSASEKISR